ncbi:MAG TPA: hypothetical protein VLS53_05350 [Candidatus Dormibacteraeota bacterium]|nr:hypothetical protein [Candidatus Dormibacteraeota bacterium]
MGFEKASPAEAQPPPEPHITIPTPPGIGAAYDLAAQKLAAQLDQIDKLDTKAGVVVGALSAGIGLFLVAAFNPVPRIVVGVGLGLAIVLAARAFLVGKYKDAPAAASFAQFAAYEPDGMKEIFLPNVLEAISENAVKVSRKGNFLNGSLGVTTLVAVLLLIGKVFGLS